MLDNLYLYVSILLISIIESQFNLISNVTLYRLTQKACPFLQHNCTVEWDMLFDTTSNINKVRACCCKSTIRQFLYLQPKNTWILLLNILQHISYKQRIFLNIHSIGSKMSFLKFC